MEVKNVSDEVKTVSYRMLSEQMLKQICKEFQKRMLETHQDVPLVVFDCDDFLWKMMRRIAFYLGIDFQTATAVFAIKENKLLTPEQQDAILTAFADERYFQNIAFEPGVADILKVCELGAEVKINSNAFTEKIAEAKFYSLLAVIPGLKPEQIQMNIVSAGPSAQRKTTDPRTTIFGDDSPYNIALSPTLLGIVPKDMPWSISPEAVKIMQGKRVFCAENLEHANQLIYQAVSALRSM